MPVLFLPQNLELLTTKKLSKLQKKVLCISSIGNLLPHWIEITLYRRLFVDSKTFANDEHEGALCTSKTKATKPRFSSSLYSYSATWKLQKHQKNETDIQMWSFELIISFLLVRRDSTKRNLSKEVFRKNNVMFTPFFLLRNFFHVWHSHTIHSHR